MGQRKQCICLKKKKRVMMCLIYYKRRDKGVFNEKKNEKHLKKFGETFYNL
jgi:hypothetical protein